MMCGICGIYNYRSKQIVNQALVKSMTNSIFHRGPDEEGTFYGDTVGLGMRRLSIIDLVSGQQPLCNEDRSIWVVFNGEIYNFLDLRDKLRCYGHIFRTNSDTETIIHAYEEWGVDGFSQLNGMFGFALWDSRSKELFLARDPFGIKPLYYYDDANRLIFGSEIKAILTDATVPREVDLAALDKFLTFTFVPSPYTLFQGIKKVQPGTFLRVGDQGITCQRLNRSRINHHVRSEANWLELLRSSIMTAVQRQMVADVPVGVMLSGGVDSATIAMLMQQSTEHPIHTFTVGFSGGFAQNELTAARRSAELIGSEHHEAVISVKEYAEFLPRSIWYLEEPVATASTMAFYWICLLAREHVKVILTGQGADEPFAGYERHLGEYYGDFYRKIPPFFRNYLIKPLIENFPRNEQLKRAVHSLDISDSLERITQIYTIFNQTLKNKLYKPGLMEQKSSPPHENIYLWQQDVKHLDGLSQMLYIDARFSLADNLLMYGDKMSMAASIEARVPFLDLELMDLVESIPPHLKIRGNTQKYILKKAISAWIPNEIITRKKIGFATPVDEWFSGDLQLYLKDLLLSRSSACTNYFEPNMIQTMLRDHASKRHNFKRQLFSLLTFELWHNSFISGFPTQRKIEIS